MTDTRLNDPAWLREQYTELGRSLADIAREVGVGRTTVHSALERHGIERERDRRARPGGRPRDDFDLGRALVLRDQDMSIRAIARELGVSPATVYRRLAELDL